MSERSEPAIFYFTPARGAYTRMEWALANDQPQRALASEDNSTAPQGKLKKTTKNNPIAHNPHTYTHDPHAYTRPKCVREAQKQPNKKIPSYVGPSPYDLNYKKGFCVSKDGGFKNKMMVVFWIQK